MAAPRGIAFPFRADDTGFPRADMDRELILDSITQILMTSLGERLMRPTFGSNLRTYLFENLGPHLVDVVKAEVYRAIITNEPRVTLLSVEVATQEEGPQPAAVTINVVYDLAGRRNQATISVGG